MCCAIKSKILTSNQLYKRLFSWTFWIWNGSVSGSLHPLRNPLLRQKAWPLVGRESHTLICWVSEGVQNADSWWLTLLPPGTGLCAALPSHPFDTGPPHGPGSALCRRHTVVSKRDTGSDLIAHYSVSCLFGLTRHEALVTALLDWLIWPSHHVWFSEEERKALRGQVTCPRSTSL